MKTLIDRYAPIPVGYSGHEKGFFPTIAAVALGATTVERHFTLDKAMPGPDHGASMNPEEFQKFVRAVRTVETALGTPEKKPTGGELENIVGMRRSICAKSDLAPGTVITEDMLCFKRPGNGLVPTENNIRAIVGKTVKNTIKFDENITMEALS